MANAALGEARILGGAAFCGLATAWLVQAPGVGLDAGRRYAGSQVSSGLGAGCGKAASAALGEAQSLESGFMLADAAQACGVAAGSLVQILDLHLVFAPAGVISLTPGAAALRASPPVTASTHTGGASGVDLRPRRLTREPRISWNYGSGPRTSWDFCWFASDILGFIF